MKEYIPVCTSRPSSPTHLLVGHICGTQVSTASCWQLVSVCTSRPSSPTLLLPVRSAITRWSMAVTAVSYCLYFSPFLTHSCCSTPTYTYCWYITLLPIRSTVVQQLVMVITSRPSSPTCHTLVLVYLYVDEEESI